MLSLKGVISTTDVKQVTPECSTDPKDTCPPGQICIQGGCYPGCNPLKSCPNGLECRIQESGALGYDLSSNTL